MTRLAEATEWAHAFASRAREDWPYLSLVTLRSVAQTLHENARFAQLSGRHAAELWLKRSHPAGVDR